VGRAPCVGRSLCVSGALCVGALCVGRSFVGPSPPVSDPFHVDIRSRDGSRSGARSHGGLTRHILINALHHRRFDGLKRMKLDSINIYACIYVDIYMYITTGAPTG